MTTDINSLHAKALRGDSASADQMFATLDVSFRLFVRHRVMNSQDGEEIVQDALTTIAEKYGSVQIETSFAGWAHKVLKNKLLDYYKAKHVRAVTAASTEDFDAQAGAPSLDPTLKRRLLDCLRKLHAVNSFHARALNLHHQGYGTDEICARLEITSNNFYVMLSRARTLLRHCLEKGEIGS